MQYIFEDRLFLVAEWTEAALAEFDEAAWTSPSVHQSAAERLVKGATALLRFLGVSIGIWFTSASDNVQRADGLAALS